MATQNVIQNQETHGDYQELLVRLPIRDDSVWIPLQKKNFGEAMNRFYSLLGYYTPKTASQIFWRSIIEGEPMVRGDVLYKEWVEEVVPSLAVIVLNIADEKLFERIYRSLRPETLIYFNSLLTMEIPGGSDEEKIEYMKDQKTWLYTFLTGSPLNALGGLFLKAETGPSYSLGNVMRRMELLSPALKGTLSSAETARVISAICANEGLSDQQTTNVSHYVGFALLGLEDPDNLGDRIGKACNLPLEKASALALKIRNDVIDHYHDEIIFLKEGSESIIKEETTVPIKAAEEKIETQPIKITKVAFPSVAEEKKATASPSGPFILHREQNIAGGASDASSPFKKGSIFSFGFFKPGGKRHEEKKEVSVKIESPEKAQEKPPSPAPLPAVKPPEPKIIAPETEAEKTKPPAPVTDIPKPKPVKVQDYAAPSATPATPLPMKTAETRPEPPKEAPPAETPTMAGTGDKKVHYSAFKTDIPQNPEAAEKPRDPHVDGNVIFFK